MKNRNFTFLFFLLLSAPGVFAQQEEDIDLFIEDMLTLAGNFSQPAADAVGYQASAGWFSSAATLEPWDFRVSVHGNALFVASDKKNFTITNSEFRLLEIEEAQTAKLPTAFGGLTDAYFTGEINALGTTNTVRFKAFDGVDRNSIPHAFLQVAVGLPRGTELTVRAMPEVTIDGVTATTFGAGLKHNFSQYFNSNDPEDFQLAAALAYSKLKVNYAFTAIEVENVLMMNEISVDANLWMLQAIASKRWGAFEPFAGVGALSSDFKYVMGGGGVFLPRVNSEIESLADNLTQVKGDVGFNLHAGRFRLSAMATLGEFFNGNLGLHFRI